MQEDTPLVKVISFALWQDEPRYVEGAFRNIELAKTIYPDWVCRIFVSSKLIKKTTIERFKTYDNVDVVLVDEDPINGSLWRFLVSDDPSVELFVVRDTDCRLSKREKEAVDQWVDSDKEFHVMRDHPFQMSPIVPNLWGMRVGNFKDMKLKTKRFIDGKYHRTTGGLAEAVMWAYIWPIAQNNSFIHDPFFTKGFDFPEKRDQEEAVWFVGEKFDENENHSEYKRRFLEHPVRVS